VEVWFEVKNPKHELKPGTSVHLSMTAQTVKDALVVPASSILTSPDGTTTVMVAGSDGLAHKKPVKLGIRNGEDVQIIEGLSEGEKVISNGAYGLPDTTKIKIEAAKAPAEEAKPQAGGSKAPSEGSDEK
jgi:multidrug efflux pump subunit AcrA (membrane-fusion protein)